MRDRQTSGDASIALMDAVANEIGKVVVGQRLLVNRLLIGLLTGGHILLEGVPGLAKTLIVKTLAAATHLTFRRIQFTPDVLSADILGTLVYNPKLGDFVVHKGPIFANLILADEINRAPAKVQSALLEVMQERSVTIGDTTYGLDEPFLVLATQNPIEHEGTYPLPEAQLDRFLLQVNVTYPTRDEELAILQRHAVEPGERPTAVLSWPQLSAARRAVARMLVAEKIEQYILDIVRATRNPGEAGLAKLSPLIRYGASPRAATHFLWAARAHAYLSGRACVLPEDVRAVCPDVLRHRVVLSYEAEADGVRPDAVVTQIMGAVPIP